MRIGQNLSKFCKSIQNWWRRNRRDLYFSWAGPDSHHFNVSSRVTLNEWVFQVPTSFVTAMMGILSTVHKLRFRSVDFENARIRFYLSSESGYEPFYQVNISSEMRFLHSVTRFAHSETRLMYSKRVLFPKKRGSFTRKRGINCSSVESFREMRRNSLPTSFISKAKIDLQQSRVHLPWSFTMTHLQSVVHSQWSIYSQWSI